MKPQTQFMKSRLLLFLIFLLPSILSAQQGIEDAILYNGELHISILKEDILDLKTIESVISIDEHYRDKSSYRAIVTLPNLEEFINLGLDYSLLPHPNKESAVNMIYPEDHYQQKSSDCSTFLNGYPTYGLYEQMMSDFADDFPELCRLEEIGVLPSGRKLLALVISANPNEIENEPRFLYTSSMHGDETAGYALLLRIIQDMLCNYSSDPAIANLVDNVEIWINPLANPDGTYAWGDDNINGARRTNNNFVDLNRNYLDPDEGVNPDGNVYQPETMLFMLLAENVHFDMSSNMHGGVEVANYPWDTWSFEHADDNWWKHVCRQYADTAQSNSPSGYFIFQNNGITNGYDWYSVAGGRQDFMTYFHRGREMTLELSDQKLLSSTQFDNHWSYNREALYNYMEQALFGLRGIVTDFETDLPIVANVSILDHDSENSDVFSRLPMGNYHRYLFEGLYEVTFSAEGYVAQSILVEIVNDETTYLDIELVSESTCNVEAGFISTTSVLSDLCVGDNTIDLIEVAVEGNSGYDGVFGVVDQANNVMQSSQDGIFSINNLPTGTYRIKHMSYAEGVNPVVSNASQLSGCYELSNSIVFNVNRVAGGVISTLESTQVCGDDGIPSTIAFEKSGAEGENSKWVVLDAGLTEVIASSNFTDFNFDSFGTGDYRVVHVSYANGVDLSEVDPLAIEGCLNTSNSVVVTVENCASNLRQYSSGTNATILFVPETQGAYQVHLLDLTGKELLELHSGTLNANQEHRLKWNPSQFTSGIYLIRARSDEYLEVKKIRMD